MTELSCMYQHQLQCCKGDAPTCKVHCIAEKQVMYYVQEKPLKIITIRIMAVKSTLLHPGNAA